MPDNSEYQKLRTLKETYAAKLARKTWEERERKLANIGELDGRQFAREQSLAKKMLSIKTGICACLAADDDARNCEEIIEAAIRAALSNGEQSNQDLFLSAPASKMRRPAIRGDARPQSLLRCRSRQKNISVSFATI